MFYKIAFALILSFFSIAAQAEVGQKEQLVKGYGATPTKAIQNAAEAALVNTVGSYIDVETFVENKTEIKGEIVKETSIFRESVLEASSGMIRKIDVLGVSEEGGIYVAEAVVTVSITDLQKLTKPYEAKGHKISKGILAGSLAAKKQEENKLELLTQKVLMPLLSGEYASYEILSVDLLDANYDYTDIVTELQSEELHKKSYSGLNRGLYPKWYPSKKRGDRGTNYKGLHPVRFIKPYTENYKADTSEIAIAAKLALDDSFIDATHRLLEQISSEKYLHTGRTGEIGYRKRKKRDTERWFCFVTASVDSHECYIVDVGQVMSFGQSKSNTPETLLMHDFQTKNVWNESSLKLAHNVQIALLNGKANVVYASDVLDIEAWSHALIGDLRNYPGYHNVFSANYHTNIMSLSNGTFIVNPTNHTLIHARIEDRVLEQTESIELRVQPSQKYIERIGGLN